MAPFAGPFQLVIPSLKGKDKRVSSDSREGSKELKREGSKELKQRKKIKLVSYTPHRQAALNAQHRPSTQPKQPLASSSRVTVEESRAAASQPRQPSSKVKKKLPTSSLPKQRPAASPARRDKHALWIELDSDDESEEGGNVNAKNILPTRRRGSTAPTAPGPSSKKRRRSSTKLEDSAVVGSAVSPRAQKRFDDPFVFSREASEASSVGEQEERALKEVSPELGLPSIDLAARQELQGVKSEEPYLPPRKEITHHFYVDIPLPRKKLSTSGSIKNKIKGTGKGPPGRREPPPATTHDPTPSTTEDSDDEAPSVISEPSGPRRDNSGPPPTKKRKVDPARAPPSPSLSPASHRPRLPHVLRKPSPLAQRQPSPSPPPPAQPFGALVDRPPPPPPPLPRRTLNPNYEPALRFGAFVNGTFPPPSPPVSTISLVSAAGGKDKGKQRARSADPLLLEGFAAGPLSSSSISSAPGGPVLLAPRDETSSGRTSIEPSPALPPSPTRISSVPNLSAPNAAAAAAAAALRRTGRATIQALPPSAVALRASSALVATATFQSLPADRLPRPDDQKKIIRKRWAHLKEHHGVGDDAHLSFEDNWRKEDGARYIREKRGQEKWKGAKSREWWKEEREQELFEEQAGCDAGEEREEKGWQYATELEVVPWEWEGVDLGRGRAWNAGVGMEPGREDHGRRWAVADPQGEEDESQSSEEEHEVKEVERPVVSMEAIRAAMDVDIVAETDDEDSDDCIVVTPAASIPPVAIPSTTVALAPPSAPHQPVARVLPPQGRTLPTIVAPKPSTVPPQLPREQFAQPSTSTAPRSSAAPAPSTTRPAPRSQPNPPPSPPHAAPTHFPPQQPYQHPHAMLHFPPPHGVPPFPHYYGQPPYPYPPPYGGYPPPPPPPPHGYYHPYPPPPPHYYPYPPPYPPYHPQHPPHPAPRQASRSSSSHKTSTPQVQPQQATPAPRPARQASPAPPPQQAQRAAIEERSWIQESGSGKATPREGVLKMLQSRPAVIRPVGSPLKANPPNGPFSRAPSAASPPKPTPPPSQPLVATALPSRSSPHPPATTAQTASSVPVAPFPSAPSPSVVAAPSGPAPSTTTSGKAISLGSDSSSDSEDVESEEVARSLRKESTGQKETSAEVGSQERTGKAGDAGESGTAERRDNTSVTKEVEVLTLSD